MFLVTVWLGYLWFQKSTEAIEKNAIEYCSQLVQTTNANLDAYFDEIEKMLLPMLTSKETRDFLTYSGDDDFLRFRTAYAVENSLIPPIMMNRSDLYGVSLVTERNIASSNIGFTSAQQRYPEYARLVSEVGNFKIIGLQQIGLNKVNVLTMAMLFSGTSTAKTSGMLVVDLNLKRIEAICNDLRLGKSGFAWLADENGKILYHPNPGMIYQQSADSYLDHFSQNRRGHYTMNTGDGIRLVLFDRSPNTGLIMVSEVRLDEQNESLISLSRTSLLSLLAFFLLLFFIMGGVSYQFTKSIILLKKLMLQAESGNLHVMAPNKKKDEIGSLYHSFNSMVEKIRELIEAVHSSYGRERSLEMKQKEAVIRAMQSQINPHFLYNTLEVINSYAIIEGNFKVSHMIVALGDMFRYSVGSPNSVVSLKEEFNHIQSYLQIQQERFEKLRFQIDAAEEDLQRCSGVRLMLQPIVENCFKHGYDKHKLRPGMINIRGWSEAEAYYIDICDTGKGMTPAAMALLNQVFQTDGSDTPEETDSHNSIGLPNVHYRIRLSFGAPYGLQILRSNQEGTTVRISLPNEPVNSEVKG